MKNLRSITIHVGVNVSNTRPLLMVLPVFEDYSFIFIPIPGNGEGVTYMQLRDSLPGVCEVLEQLRFSVDNEVHNDPEFVGFTFGEGPRDWMLAKLHPGDYVFFVASMKKVPVPSKTDFLKHPKKYKPELKSLLKRNRGPNWFYGLIAQIKISEIYAGKNVIKRYDLGDQFCELNNAVEDKLLTNAHIKRGDHFSGDYVIIKGEENESKVYEQALPISQGNICLTELQEIFYKHLLRRNRAKWFEVILDNYGTASLQNFTKRKLKS
jgi:hypothetical protein